LSKLFSVYINELIKNLKKISIVIMLIVMVVTVIGIGAIMKISQVVTENNIANNSNMTTTQMKDNIKQQQDSTINEVKTRLDAAKDDLTKQTTQVEYNTKKAAIAAGIDLSTSGYRAAAINSVIALKQDNILAKLQQPTTYDKTGYDLNQKLSDEYYNAAINDDFKAYIAADNENINASTQMSDVDKTVNLYANDLKLKYNIKGSNNSFAYTSDDLSYSLQLISNEKRSLLTGLDYTSTDGVTSILTPDNRSSITNKLAIGLYQLAHYNPKTSSSPIDKDLSTSAMGSYGIIVLVILMIILGGATISQEISTGSIKALIISPVNRWKMIVAKYAALLSIALVFYFLLYIVTMLISGVLFGFSGNPYIYAVSGNAYGMNFYLYQFLYGLLGFIVVVIYMTFAVMLSTVTRNTAASVGLGIGVYFIGGAAVTALALLSSFLRGEWIKFIPFENFNLAAKVFPSNSLSVSSLTGSAVTGQSIPLSFSIIYIVVISVLMFYTTLDSFCRREIK
jgi:ABC-type transport system involved in multi-copper enzyme maturation permease subunit